MPLDLCYKVFYSILEKICRLKFKRIIIISAHGPGFHQFVKEACKEIARKFEVKILYVHVWELITKEELVELTQDKFIHGACAETSLILYLRPELVKLERVKEEGLKEILKGYRVYPYKREKYYKGNPRLASKEIGEKLFKLLVKRTLEVIESSL